MGEGLKRAKANAKATSKPVKAKPGADLAKKVVEDVHARLGSQLTADTVSSGYDEKAVKVAVPKVVAALIPLLGEDPSDEAENLGFLVAEVVTKASFRSHKPVSESE